MNANYYTEDYLMHYGVLGMHWGRRKIRAGNSKAKSLHSGTAFYNQTKSERKEAANYRVTHTLGSKLNTRKNTAVAKEGIKYLARSTVRTGAAFLGTMALGAGVTIGTIASGGVLSYPAIAGASAVGYLLYGAAGVGNVQDAVGTIARSKDILRTGIND